MSALSTLLRENEEMKGKKASGQKNKTKKNNVGKKKQS